MSTADAVLVALKDLEASLSEEFRAQIGDLRLEMNARFDAVEARLAALRATEIQELIRRIEAGLAEP